MKFKLVEKIELNEMAYSQRAAVNRCGDLGYEFATHFVKIMDDGANHEDFAHRCKEMQAWWNKVKSIKLKSNNKIISNKNLFDWFFTYGSDVAGVIENEEYRIAYEALINELLKNRNREIIDIFNKNMFEK